MIQSIVPSLNRDLPAGYKAFAEHVAIAFARIQAGRSAKNILLIGTQGIGKTAILRELSKKIRAENFITIEMVAKKNWSLPKELIAPMNATLLHLSRMGTAGQKTELSQRILGSFIGTVTCKNSEAFANLGTELGMADNGSLEGDLCDVFLAIGDACKECGTAIGLFIDDLQLVSDSQLSALLYALHRCAQKAVPIILVGTGLPQLIKQTGQAKSYSERLFDFYHIV